MPSLLDLKEKTFYSLKTGGKRPKYLNCVCRLQSKYILLEEYIWKSDLYKEKYRLGNDKLLWVVAVPISLLDGTLKPTLKDSVLHTVSLFYNSVIQPGIHVNMIDHISKSQNPHYYHWLIAGAMQNSHLRWIFGIPCGEPWAEWSKAGGIFHTISISFWWIFLAFSCEIWRHFSD